MALSDRMILTQPRLEINIFRTSKNECVDKSPANSIWIARVVRHVNITQERLIRALVDLVSLFFDKVWYNVIHSSVAEGFFTNFNPFLG